MVATLQLTMGQSNLLKTLSIEAVPIGVCLFDCGLLGVCMCVMHS